MKEEYAKLLELNWIESEKIIIKSMFNNLNYYKNFTSNSSKNDIIKVINMIIELKTENENCKCKNNL